MQIAMIGLGLMGANMARRRARRSGRKLTDLVARIIVVGHLGIRVII